MGKKSSFKKLIENVRSSIERVSETGNEERMYKKWFEIKKSKKRGWVSKWERIPKIFVR